MTILEKIKFEEDWLSEVNLTKENVKIAFAGIRATALESQRWIPVEEKLPEDGQHVMVTFGGKIAFCLAQDNNGTLTEITSLISKDANVLYLYPEAEWGDGYEAWMPLPAPYQPPTIMCEED